MKERGEPVNLLFEQRLDGFDRDIAAGEARAARGQDDVDGRIGDPVGDLRPDRGKVIPQQHPLGEPVARGGDSRAGNIRLRCRAHNQLEAERVYGKGFMQARREQAKAATSQRRSEREAKRAADEALDRDELMPGLRGLGYSRQQARFALAECKPSETQTLELRLKRCLAILAPPHLSVRASAPAP